MKKRIPLGDLSAQENVEVREAVYVQQHGGFNERGELHGEESEAPNLQYTKAERDLSSAGMYIHQSEAPNSLEERNERPAAVRL